MIKETLPLKEQGSLDYARLIVYRHELSPEIAWQERPMVIVCPGGGYEYTSDREADILALQFAAAGYHAAVLRYSTAPAEYPTALLELGRSILTVREHAPEWGVDGEKIVLLGCSAGGHLAGSMGCFWNRSFLSEGLDCEAEDLHCAGMILCYPVITSGEHAHHGSFRALLGERYEALKEELSLEHCVTDQTIPAFLWATCTDGSVPAQNSLLIAGALQQHQIPYELHIYPKGGHGLSLANRITDDAGHNCDEPVATDWIRQALRWVEELPYEV